MTGSGKVHICLGPGGVGKTTAAASLAIAAAVTGERVVVLTIDPARRLATTLGLGDGSALGNEPKIVAGPWSGELWAAMLDPGETLTALIRENAAPAQAERVLTNSLFATITESLSGVNEYMAAERLHALHADPRFDRVIIDTPPARHAVDFIDSPERLRNFVDNRFYRAVLAPKRRIARSVNAAAQVVVRLTARLVGADLVDDVVRLFADLEGLDDGFRRRAVATAELLASRDCSFVLVSTARREPLREAAWIRARLAEREKTAAAFIANRLMPTSGSSAPARGTAADRAALQANVDQLAALAAEEEALLAESLAELRGPDGLGVDISVHRIVERGEPIRSIDDLVVIAEQLATVI